MATQFQPQNSGSCTEIELAICPNGAANFSTVRSVDTIGYDEDTASASVQRI
jgi:hypothetical protein